MISAEVVEAAAVVGIGTSSEMKLGQRYKVLERTPSTTTSEVAHPSRSVFAITTAKMLRRRKRIDFILRIDEWMKLRCV